jgi:hypothetical protein
LRMLTPGRWMLTFDDTAAGRGEIDMHPGPILPAEAGY